MECCIFFSSVEKTILLMFLQGRGQQWEEQEWEGSAVGRGRSGRGQQWEGTVVGGAGVGGDSSRRGQRWEGLAIVEIGSSHRK